MPKTKPYSYTRYDGHPTPVEILEENKSIDTSTKLRQYNGLTGKQELFAQIVARSNVSYVEAYRHAYGQHEMANNVASVKAYEVADKPHVNQRINELLDERFERSWLKDTKRLRQYILDRLLVESSREDNTGGQRIKAVELLGKIDVVGMFTEKREVDVTNHGTAKELKSKLEQRLRELAQSINTIDVTPTEEEMAQGRDEEEAES